MTLPGFPMRASFLTAPVLLLSCGTAWVRGPGAGPDAGNPDASWSSPDAGASSADAGLPDSGPEDGGPGKPDGGQPTDAGISVSASKLGVHELGSTTDGPTLTILGGCPRTVKWMSNGGLASNGQIAAAISAYKATCGAGATAILRVYVSSGTASYSTSNDPAASADDYWSKMQPGLAGIDPSEVDWLEGPNELDNVPDWYHDLVTANWVATFWSRLADDMNAATWRPLVASIAVGNPALAGDLGAGQPCAMQPLADVMKGKPYRIGWSYHAYSPSLSEDPNTEQWYSLRYRLISQQTGLAGYPVVLTEGGQDAPGGWQGRTSASTYDAWLRWFDLQEQADSDVAGLTIFQCGDRGTWAAFDLAPIAGNLAAYLQSPAAGRSCGQWAAAQGWTSAACEANGSGACGGVGPETTDCDHCCL